MHNFLSTLILIPLIGAVFILFVPKGREGTLKNIRWIALVTTLVTFGVSLLAWHRFDPTSAEFQLVEQGSWISDSIRFKLGVDGYSMPFIILSTFLMPFCIGASWISVEKRVAEYMIAFLVLEALMIGVFAALDLVLFYVFFEAGLIPMFLIIGVWGANGAFMRALNFSSTRCWDRF